MPNSRRPQLTAPVLGRFWLSLIPLQLPLSPVRVFAIDGHGTMFSMSTRLVSLIRRIFMLLAFARPRAAGIMLSSRA